MCVVDNCYACYLDTGWHCIIRGYTSDNVLCVIMLPMPCMKCSLVTACSHVSCDFEHLLLMIVVVFCYFECTLIPFDFISHPCLSIVP